MGLVIVWVALAVLTAVGVVAYFIVTYNRLLRLRNSIDKAWAGIDVLLKQCHDELPKLVETCRDYIQHEQEAFQVVARARKAYQSAHTVQDKARADRMMTDSVRTLFAVAEDCSELKASNSFLRLQNRISDLEEKIADRSEYFNNEVNAYNTQIRHMPGVLPARVMKLQPREMFRVLEPEGRLNGAK